MSIKQAIDAFTEKESKCPKILLLANIVLLCVSIVWQFVNQNNTEEEKNITVAANYIAAFILTGIVIDSVKCAILYYHIKRSAVAPTILHLEEKEFKKERDVLRLFLSTMSSLDFFYYLMFLFLCKAFYTATPLCFFTSNLFGSACVYTVTCTRYTMPELERDASDFFYYRMLSTSNNSNSILYNEDE